VFGHRGDLPPQFADFMSALIEASSHVVVLGTNELHHAKNRGQVLVYVIVRRRVVLCCVVVSPRMVVAQR
jgi:hypothetical protein